MTTTTRNLTHLAARLYGTPLMLLPSSAEVFGNAFQTLLERGGIAEETADASRPQAFAPNIVRSRFKDKPYAVTDDGIGLIGVYGALLQRHEFDPATCTAFASYQVLQARMQAMLRDPDVKAVLFEWDSPGGEVAGNFALANSIAAGAKSSGKPVWSHVNEAAFSAAYSLAASTERIVVPAGGRVGSIGVVAVHVDQSKRDERMGVTWTYVYAGKHKIDGNPHAPLTKQAMARFESSVMRAYDAFVGHVALARGIGEQAVRNTEAGIFHDDEAKAIGLVDATGGFDDTLAELAALVRRGATSSFSPVGGSKAAQTPVKGATMSQTNAAAPAADPPQNGVPETDVQAREAVAFARGQQAERERVSGVRAALLPGHEKLVEQLAADGKTTPAEAAMAVLAAERTATTAATTAHRADAPAAVPTAAAPDAADAKPKGKALGQSMVAAFREFTGSKGA